MNGSTPAAGGLPAERETLMLVSAAHASRDEAALRTALSEAAVTVGPEPVEEVLLQAYLFLGFPAAIWAFGIWRSLDAGLRHTEHADRGQLSREAGGSATDRASTWERAGEAVCARVYSGNYEKLRRNVEALHPELDRWMILEGYGKVLSRPTIDLPTRELCIVASLAVTGWEPQLHSHLRGALNAGAEPAEAEAALEAGLRYAPTEEWRQRARTLWQQVSRRHVR
jgi:4-carboxymuconolactone decarboxylase